MTSVNFSSLNISALYEKLTPKISMCSVFRFIHLAPKRATFAPFFTPIPAIPHFDLFILSPEYFEKMSKVLKISIADFSFFKKKVVSSA